MIALDIGTRSIIAAEHDGGTIARLAFVEHAGIFMREGTIHDFAGAVATIRAARERLGLPEGTPAAMAIAGGAMTMRRVRVAVAGAGPWTEEDLAAAESKALAGLISAKNLKEKLFLGARRSAPRLDERPVGSLVGLSGGKATFDLVAAFVPAAALRLKLRAAIEAGFRPERVTAEPLAVSRALFGRDLPPARFAVCDVGAGTSDLAVVSPKGLESVGAVGVAGDTITESIARALGLSFIEADAVKRDPEREAVDLWGERRRFGREAVAAAAAEGTGLVAAKIAAAIRKTAGPFDGVILAGGGSLWSDLAPRLAEALGIESHRIRTRDAASIEEIDDRSGAASGPIYLTLYGIILSRHESVTPALFSFSGRDHAAMLRLEEGAVFTAADAVTLAGEDPLDYFGEPGEAFVEGDEIRAGEAGGEPVVRIDGRIASLDAALPPGARLEIERGVDGRDAAGAVGEVPAAVDRRDACSTEAGRETGVSPVLPSGDLQECGEKVGENAPASASDAITADSSPVASLDPLESPTAGFMIINGAPVYCGERIRFERGADGQQKAVEKEPPLLGEIVPLPAHRSIQITVNGALRAVRDRTRSALVNNRRVRASERVAWESVISTARGPWRLYEALEGETGLPRRIERDGRALGLCDEISEGDAVTIDSGAAS
jgi:cell division ATPase FtsA